MRIHQSVPLTDVLEGGGVGIGGGGGGGGGVAVGVISYIRVTIGMSHSKR